MRDDRERGRVVFGAPPTNGQHLPPFVIDGNGGAAESRRSRVPDRARASIEPLGEPQAEMPLSVIRFFRVRRLPLGFANMDMLRFGPAERELFRRPDGEAAPVLGLLFDDRFRVRWWLHWVEQPRFMRSAKEMDFFFFFTSWKIMSGLRKRADPRCDGSLFMGVDWQREVRGVCGGLLLDLRLSREGCHQSFSRSAGSILQR